MLWGKKSNNSRKGRKCMTILNGRNNSIGKFVIYSCILFACLACTICISSLGYKKTVERNYDIEKRAYENLGKVDDGESNVDITYPYIVSELNPDAYNKVNDLILEEILEHCEIDICSYEIGYEIKHKDENYLSILF